MVLNSRPVVASPKIFLIGLASKAGFMTIRLY